MSSASGNSLSNAVTYDPNTYGSDGNTNEVCGSYTPPTAPTDFAASLDIL